MAPDPQEGNVDSVALGSYDTVASLPASHRRAYWRDALSRTFGAVHISVPEEVRHGTIRATPLNRLRAVTVTGDCQDALRTLRQARQDGQDEYVVVKLLDQGVARLEQDGREAVLRPGDIAVYDLARPVRLHLPQSFRTKSLALPRHALGLSDSDIAQITARPLAADSPLAGLISPFLSGFVDGAGTYPSRVGELMARNVVDLLGVLTDEVLGNTATESAGGNRALLLRIKAYIDERLADPDLSPQSIAADHHISLRYLHKLFESEDATVGRWIQRRRLEECRRALTVHRHATIAAIASRWGFTSAAHFSRVFRAAYGISPREWRGAQELTIPPARLVDA